MADSMMFLSTVRVGQLTGSTAPSWPRPVDPEGWPLLNDTTPWGVVGVDLGAPAEHCDGKLYIFFGDVATNQRPGDPPLNSDLVTWTDDRHVLEHGGHLPIGWEFVLPFRPTGIGGQDEWRFCLKCAALFWNGDPHFRGVCASGGTHDAFGVGLNFVIPFEPTSEPGQPEWHFCGKCGSMFWDGDPAFKGRCPFGGDAHSSIGFRFVMRVAPQPPAAPIEGQPKWRFCANCAGLFWDGYPQKGVCAGAPGGGFRLNAVVKDGQFDPFRALPPINFTESLETPNGAFCHDGIMYVFAGISEFRWSRVRRDGDPALGHYLFSKADPSSPGHYNTEFLFSPRLGWCAADASRSAFLSHNVLGFQFVLPHDLPPSNEPRERQWRSCKNCDALFWDGDAGFKGICQRGGPHEADPHQPAYALEFGLPEDSRNQANWHRCQKCLALFWNGNAPDTGLCSGQGLHEPSGPSLRLPHVSIEEDATHQANWRFCRKCFGLFFDGYDDNKGVCPRDGGPHQPQGFNFVVPHSIPESPTIQAWWRYCFKCSTMFFDGFPDKGRCPGDGGVHDRAGLVFSLPHEIPESHDRQTRWRFCTKCVGLFFDGYDDNKGVCPRDGQGHTAAGFDFGLPHNPGVDGNNRGKWRRCTRCHGMVRSDQVNWFPWVSPVRVSNADHEVLHSQSRTGEGVVMIGFDWSQFRLAWMPLAVGQAPRFDTIRYYHKGRNQWMDSPESSAGYELFSHPFPGSYTHVSALWLAGLDSWVVVYATAWNERKRFEDPIVARFSRNLRDWSDPVSIFNPRREQAYTRYMHLPGEDPIYPNLPPADPNKEEQGWAYGAFLLERFTRFDRARGVLHLFYLLSLGTPYQVQLMHSRVYFPTKVSPIQLTYGGSGTAPVGRDLPFVGTFYGIGEDGDLHWYRYTGSGQHDPAGGVGWNPNSGNVVARGWRVQHLLGCGDGIILAVVENGDLLWFAYDGGGEADFTGTRGWRPNSGNPIGNGWGGFRNLVVLPQTGDPSNRLKVLAVTQEGDLLWYSYEGHGEADVSGSTGWHRNSGNPIGNGWQGFHHLHGSNNVIFAVQENGDLLWYCYEGSGESDVSGATGWHPNSGNPIGNGWQNFRHIFGGVTDDGGLGHVIYAVTHTGDLLWYRYDGQGEADVSGASGWHPSSGSTIRRGW